MELYLITGFLGAGKTTFLKNFARQFAGRRLRLIINEFGRAGVDGTLLRELDAALDEISNGSIFCACRLDQFEAALEQAEALGMNAAFTACAGLLAGGALLWAGDWAYGRLAERGTHSRRRMMLMAGMTLHNIPEGLALGVVIAAAMQDAGMSWTAALAFGAGLALQNFPEGMAVVLPLRQSGTSRKRCVWWGWWASLAEPAAAVAGILLTAFLNTLGGVVMPLSLGLAAGAMIFIVVEELIPESQAGGHGHTATYGFLLGFWLMALLGVLGG